jgi:hypothetical protein
MAGFTPINSAFNTGADISVTIADQNNNNVPLGKIMQFTSKPTKGQTEIKPINSNGVYFHKNHFNGWTFEIDCYRQDGTLDALEYAQESAYQSGGVQNYYTVNVIIQNQLGTVDEFTFTNCLLSISSAGDWKEDDSVQIKIEGTAEQRVVINA